MRMIKIVNNSELFIIWFYALKGGIIVYLYALEELISIFTFQVKNVNNNFEQNCLHFENYFIMWRKLIDVLYCLFLRFPNFQKDTL